jgi:hypothetical protein
LIEIAAQLGLSLSEVKREIAGDARARSKWRRKRDRRASYKGRLQEVPEQNLKGTMLEMKTMSDIVKSLGRVGML